MQIRDGPAAVRGDAPRRDATGPRAGKAAREGAPSQKTCRPPPIRTPRGRRIRVKASLHSRRRRCGGAPARPVGPGRCACTSGSRARPAPSSARPSRRSRVSSNALDALDSASLAGEFYYHVTTTAFGPYVDQIGRYSADGSSGWVFKVNGVSPPVGADAVTLQTGDRVLWYWATFGPTGRAGDARAPEHAERNCYRVLAQNDAGKTRPARGAMLHVGARSGARANRLGLHRAAPRACAGDAEGRGSVERAGVTRVALLGSRRSARRRVRLGGGRLRAGDRLGHPRPRRRSSSTGRRCRPGSPRCRGSTRVAKLQTRYGGRYVRAVDGVKEGGRRAWFYYVNGYLADRGAADYRLHAGDVEWWDYRSWRDPAQDPGRGRRVPRAVPARLRGEDSARWSSSRTSPRDGRSPAGSTRGSCRRVRACLETRTCWSLTRGSPTSFRARLAGDGPGAPVRDDVHRRSSARSCRGYRFRYSVP